MSNKQWGAAAIAMAIAGFTGGFIAHRQQLHEPPTRMLAAVAGMAGGCGVADMALNPERTSRLERARETSRKALRELGKSADGYSQWETAIGRLWSPPGNTPWFAAMEQLAEVYTEGAMALKPGDVVIDCGANIGDFVSVCVRAGVAKVIAVEPSPVNVECLRRSFSDQIESGQVVVVPKGVWHEDSTMTMITYENSLLDSFVMKDRRENRASLKKPVEITLPVTTIDAIVNDLKLDKVTFIKMDVEGAERNALRGAASTIKRFRPRMSIATENLEDDYIAVPQEMAKIESNYDIRCGICRKVGLISYRPDILFFQPISNR